LPSGEASRKDGAHRRAIAAAGVAYRASLPPEANARLMTVMAAKTPYIGRG